MKLQILIPQYDEDFSILKPLLDSIALQQSVDLEHDVGVIIVNDGSEVLIDEANFNQYPFDIKYIKAEHGGVSAARDRAFNEATADYVMFCDADDMFFNLYGLYIVFHEMNGKGFDALISIFTEETRDPKTKEPVFINHQMDTTFVHGKIYRRKFLEDKKIRWNHNLSIHEDSYFNCLAYKSTKDIKFCRQPFYIWKWRAASVCRHDPKYILKTYNNMLDSNTALVKEFLNRGQTENAMFYISSMIYNAYFTMNKKDWMNQENQEYRINTEKRFKEYYLEFKDYFDDTSEKMKSQVIVGLKNRFFSEGVFMESVTFDDWIAHVLTL